ncbi:uncharacterized protein LOC144175361 [Haemaphysalis longicornis]
MEIQRKKRRAVRSQVTRIVKEIDECFAASAEPTVEALKAILQRLEMASVKLSEVDAAIERCLTDEDADEEFEQVLEYSDKIANSLGRLKHKIETQRLSRQAQAPSTSSNEPQPQKTSAPKAKLPKLELIRFDGKRKNWQPFWEQFEQSVHKNADLTASDRFHYLRSLLTGDAAAAIAGLPATAQCYSDAVDLLQQRFGSPAALIQEHMQGLIDAQPLTSSKNVPALRRLYDRLQVHMRGLKSLGVADESYSAMLYPVLLRVLPADMILDYHRRQAEDSDGTSSAASANGDSASTGSSASSQGSPLRSLLHFYRRELESRERAAESRPDDNHGKPPPPFRKHHAASDKGPPRTPTVKDEFKNNIETVNGRYQVKLPWKNNVKLSDNRAVAEKRFRSLTKRLNRAPELMERYDTEMRRLIDDGVAEEAPTDPHDGNQRTYYMPHQPVLRDNSTTTKLRIVFDASSHSTDANSLNDNLDSGPNLNPDLVRLLLNFRSHPVALVADAEKAFLQISVAPEDRDALRFLWFARKPENDKPLPQIAAYRMTRVPFGTTSSPFLLAATLQCHLEKMEQQYPETAKMLKNCIYVDDVLCGASSEEEAVKVYGEVNRIFAAASMRLHKWGSNSSQMRELFAQDSLNEVPLGQPANLLKVLGLTWLPNEDLLTFAPDPVIKFSAEQRNTKRFVLQTSARLYDPLGLLSAFTVRAKTLFQEIWKANIAWDDPLPDHLLNEWTKWCQELPLLSEMSIPRTYEGNIGGNPVHRTLHVFCDASQKAYGAAAYLCTESSTGERTCTLIMAKCRVAPVKPITLARLELMGALMASRLCQFIGSSLKLHIDSIHLWTDSMITLHWIRGDAARWKEFVKNRVAEIQQNTDVAQWRHCPGKGNPADLMTRGMTAASLKSSDMWWHGPSWIRQQEEVWPSEERPSGFTPEELETKKEVNVATTTCEEQPDLLKLTRFSSATKVNRVTGWVMRFLHNLRSKEKTSGPLTAAEIERAEEYWLKKAQQTAFSDEIRRTTQRMKLSNDSSLKDFNLFTDEKGLLRIRGRLCSANKTRDERHPIVMPKEHRYTVLLVNRAHLQLLHAGARDTLVQLRERYWIVRGRQLVKSVVRSCAVCRRYSASHIEADTGLLPPERTTKAEPFEVVGIDFAGPLFVNEKDKMVKVYIVLFTCAVTRAVHLELVTDMSTGTFIHAFRRFVSRRGLCRVVYSDNALTFKRASKDMGNLWKALRHPDSQSYFSNSGIEWKFIAERAPWWGGFYERMVRSVKLALKKTIGRQTLGFVELSTVLAEVEAVINSRPLTYTYDDPNDGAPLTPACFLAGRRLTTLPLHEEKFVESSATSLRLLWQKRKQILHLFWNVWRKEYLGQLRSAYASKKTKGGVPGVGDVVLIREDRPRLLWKTGIVTAVFPGRDGKIRSCEVRVPQGKTVKRPVQLLFPLETT